MTNTSANRQRGATLVVSLIMLVILTLFAVSGFNLSSVNLKITGNYQMQKGMEAAAQQAIEQVISSTSAFNLTPTASTICVNGGFGCIGGYNVAIAAPKCNYSATAKGYSKKLGELGLEDTTWEVRADVSDALTGAKATVVQGVTIKLLAGNCP
jgi:Tfp pilus assembly protein PilX